MSGLVLFIVGTFVAVVILAIGLILEVRTIHRDHHRPYDQERDA